MKFIYNFYFIIENDNNLNSNYDFNNKLLFSGCILIYYHYKVNLLKWKMYIYYLIYHMIYL